MSNNKLATRSEHLSLKDDSKDEVIGIFLAFIDAIEKPISNLIVKITADGDKHELRTDQKGTLPIVNFGKKVDKGTVTVVLPTGMEETILEFQNLSGLDSYTCKSPYVLVKGSMDDHKGEANKNEAKIPQKLGDAQDKRSANGNPVREVILNKPVCSNADNLFLDVNEQYRPQILAAYKRSKIIPQAIAALINAEAGRIVEVTQQFVTKNGKRVVDKAGKPLVIEVKKTTNKWKPDSSNSKSSARGLTQFLSGTWLGMAKDTSTFLHAKAIEKEYIAQKNETVIVKKAVPEIKAQKGKPGHPAQPAVTREKITYVIQQEKKLLDLRSDPECAIITAVEYGMQNMKDLTKTFKKIIELNDSDKAKFFYLAHHLGVSDAKKFILNKIEEDDMPVLDKAGKPKMYKGRQVQINGAKTLLVAQVGVERAERLAKKEDGSNYVLAHRRWLLGYIDKQIKPSLFACDESMIAAEEHLFALIKNIGGSHPVGYV